MPDAATLSGIVDSAPGQHRWWTASTWRQAYCLHCGADYVAWYELTQTRPDLAELADACPNH